MQQLLTRKPADAQKLTHRLLFNKPSSGNQPPYAENNFNLPQITEVQQHFEPWNI